MGGMLTTATPRPFFQITRLRLRLWPILLAAILMQAMLVPARNAARWVFKAHPAWLGHQLWGFVVLAELVQMIVGLIVACALRRILPRAQTHLQWPPDRSYAGVAVLIGIGMAGTMLVADYWHDLLHQTAPKTSYELTPMGIPGWLFAEGLAGPNEELVFRGVLVGMLAVLVPGRVQLGRIDLPVAGVLVGILFAAAHYQSFIVDPLSQAVAQQLYAFIWGLIYVWLMERSRSLLAPAIAHGIGNTLEVAAVMLLTLMWH